MEYHEDWNRPDFNNDIALITVTEPFDFTDPNVQPIEMFLSADAPIPANTLCNSTGWGLTHAGGIILPNALQWAQLPLLSRGECEEIFPGYINDGTICAGDEGHTTCNVNLLPYPLISYLLYCYKDDAGGPLVCPDENGNGKLAGIVSFGYYSAGCTAPTGFTKVKNYEDWITARLEP